MKHTRIVLIVYLFFHAVSSFASEQNSKQAVLDSLNYYLGEAKSYTYDQNRKVFADIDRLIVNGINEHALSSQIEERLLHFLETDATLASKQIICIQLSIHGTESSVKVFEKMLKSRGTFDMALFALERLPYPAADKVLREYLAESPEVGVINTLGRRRSEEAIKELKPLTTRSESNLRKAAIQAIAEISGETALEILRNGRSEAQGAEKTVYSEAMLICADKFAKDGEVERAISTYQSLMQSSESKNVRRAAFIGWVSLDKKNADKLVYEAISKRDENLIASAIDLIPQVCSQENVKTIAELMPQLEPVDKIQLYAALVATADRSVAADIVSSLDPANDELCKAGIRAVSQLGDSSHVAVLLELAVEHPQYENSVRENLALMKGNAIDRSMVAMLDQSSLEMQILIVKIFADRQSMNIENPLISELSAVEDNRLRREIIKTLGVVSDPSFFMPIFEFLFEAKNSTELRELERTLATIARKMSDSRTQIQPVLDRYPAVQDVDLQCALLRILGLIGNPEALPVIEKALTDSTYQIKKAAYQSLASWPDAEPQNRLLKLVDSTENKELKSIALHGYIGMIPDLWELDAEEKLAHYQAALDRAVTLNDQQVIFAGMAELPTISSLDIIGNYLDDPRSRPYAEKAIIEIMRDQWWKDREKVRILLLDMQSHSSDEEVVSFATTMLARIDE